jgi:hypothetical protein
MNDKVKQTLQAILEQFKTGDIPKAVVISMFPIPDIPCSKWSLLNRTLVFLSGTMDARDTASGNRRIMLSDSNGLNPLWGLSL